MTYREALENGYRIGDRAFHRGYISRKIHVADQPVLVAGGNRKGQLYVNVPNYRSTQYGTIRLYLIKESEA